MMRHLSLSFLLVVLFFGVFSLHAQVNNVSPNSISLTIGANAMKLPYYRNSSLSVSSTKFKRAVVIIHGTDRNADDYYNTAVAAVGTIQSELDSTLIIAPQFLEQGDVQAHGLGSNYLFWSNSGGWKSGSNSANSSPSVKISSFAVLDTILKRITDNNPNLKIIVVCGHSAGGQVVNRYAATSPAITTICQQNHIPVRFIVSNPSSYLYVTNERRTGSSLNQFSVPSTSCSTYDDWKYGLGNLFAYPNAVGASVIKQQYGDREVVYLLGGADSLNSNDIDTSCEANLQGKHRLERGNIFYNYVQHVYGPSIYQKHFKSIVPGVGHSHSGVFTSSQGINHILRMDTLRQCEVLTAHHETLPTKRIHAYPVPAKDMILLERDDPDPSGNISISDLTGNLVKRYPGDSRMLDVSLLAPGMYFLKIESKGGYYLQKMTIIRD